VEARVGALLIFNQSLVPFSETFDDYAGAFIRICCMKHELSELLDDCSPFVGLIVIPWDHVEMLEIGIPKRKSFVFQIQNPGGVAVEVPKTARFSASTLSDDENVWEFH
jgi:hypothetical protein